MTLYDLKCNECEKVLGTSSIENTDAFKCAACAQAGNLPDALANGTNLNVEDLQADQPDRLRTIVNAAIFAYPDKVIGLHYGDDLEAAKDLQLAALDLDDVLPAVQIRAIEIAKENGVTAETISAETLADHKAAAVLEATP